MLSSSSGIEQKTNKTKQNKTKEKKAVTTFVVAVDQ